ncbi:sialyltransferase [uncultured Methanobrevibacter sp.]|uniref:sialyltransferase n=1 Tax=uncultured Methanobrevibacter sp. TaxID=253161 RepID=UPI0025DF1187|nr:sialyltransferase [uncultured Methanobrevibacter sp.]
MWSIKDFSDVFFSLEHKYNLNNAQIDNVYFWPLIRMYLYYDIARKLNIFGSAQQKTLSLSDKILSFLPFVKNSLLKSPYSGKDDLDIIIFDHPRKVLYQNKYHDIYTYFFCKYLDKYNKKYEIIESPYLNNHFSEDSTKIRYNDRILLLSYLYKKTHKVKFTDSERGLLRQLLNDLSVKFNIDFNYLENVIKDHILNFKYEYNSYKKLLSKKNPKQVYVVVAYENMALVAAARHLGIEVLELQHGTISNYHMGYSYPNEHNIIDEDEDFKKAMIPYFPDKLLSFGDYWENASFYPLKTENILPLGYSYFEKSYEEFKNLSKNNYQILFISQGVIGKYLSRFAVELFNKLSRENSDYNFIYKLHPGEYDTWRENYPELLRADKNSNFKVIDNSQTPLYKLFAESKYQVGSFSTAIYEGLQFDCISFIVDLPGVEYLDVLIEEGILCKVQSPDDLIKNMDFTPKAYDKDYFFKGFDEELFKKIIK